MPPTPEMHSDFLALLAPSYPTVKLVLTGVYRGAVWFCQVVV